MGLFNKTARIAEFEKVSFEKFKKAYEDCFSFYDDEEDLINPVGHNDFIQKVYNNIKMPQRATKGSAGYDIYATSDFKLKQGETIKIPTGIRCKMKEGWVLQVFPRSGLGFKFRLQLDNTVGIIDSDYYYSDNEGHIFIKITNDSKEDKTVSIKEGEAFCQGIFLQYGTVVNDKTDGIRNGGFGSTNKK